MSIERIYLTIIKAVLDKPTANIILNSEKLKAFPLKIRNKTGMSTVITFFFFNTTVRKEKEIKEIQIGREEVKLLLFVDDMILCIEKS